MKGDITELSKPDWRTRSSKVEIAARDKEKVFNPDMWGSGVRVGYFHPARKPMAPSAQDVTNNTNNGYIQGSAIQQYRASQSYNYISLVDICKSFGKTYGMKYNPTKTVVMCMTDRKETILPN